jgi:hypothetical protein
VVDDVHDEIIEFFDPTTLATTQRERMEFSRIPVPNDNWMVWFGMADNFPWAFHHYGRLIDRGHNVAVDLSKPPSVVSPRCNVQSTAIRVGKLLVLTYSSRATLPGLAVDPTLFAVKHGLHLIWPMATTGLNASPLRHLTKEEVIEVAWQCSGRLNPRSPKPNWPPQLEPEPFVRIGRRYSPLIK